MQPFLLVAVSFPATRVLKPTEQDLEYLTYDASYGVHVDEKSHTGTAITLGKGVVYDGPRLSARCCYDLPGKYDFIFKDRVDKGDVKIEYKPTCEMVADILTKPLQGSLFVKLRNEFLNSYVA